MNMFKHWFEDEDTADTLMGHNMANRYEDADSTTKEVTNISMIEHLDLYNPGGHEDLIQQKLNELIDRHNALESILVTAGIISYKEDKE